MDPSAWSAPTTRDLAVRHGFTEGEQKETLATLIFLLKIKRQGFDKFSGIWEGEA